MEIKRKFEKLVVTKRRFIIRHSSSGKQTVCSECREPMLTIEQAANLLGIKQRRIFQIIENETVHYNETETGAVMICLKSLTNILEENGNE